MVDVRHVHAHAVALVIQTGEEGQVDERPVAAVAVEFVGLVGVVGQVQILIAVVVVIEEDAAHAHPSVQGSGLEVDVGEALSAVVLEEVVDGVDVDHVQIGETVFVVVGRVKGSTHQGAVQAPSFRHVDEGAVSLVDVEPVGLCPCATKAISRGEVEVPVVVDVEPNGGVCEAFIGDACLGAHLGEGHVSVVSVERVGCKLGPDVDVLESVVVVVPNRHGVVLSLCGETGCCADVGEGGGGLGKGRGGPSHPRTEAPTKSGQGGGEDHGFTVRWLRNAAAPRPISTSTKYQKFRSSDMRDGVKNFFLDSSYNA